MISGHDFSTAYQQRSVVSGSERSGNPETPRRNIPRYFIVMSLTASRLHGALKTDASLAPLSRDLSGAQQSGNPETTKVPTARRRRVRAAEEGHVMRSAVWRLLIVGSLAACATACGNAVTAATNVAAWGERILLVTEPHPV